MSINFNTQLSSFQAQEIYVSPIAKEEVPSPIAPQSIEEFLQQRADLFKLKDWKWVEEAVDVKGRPYVIFENLEGFQFKLTAPNDRMGQFNLPSPVKPEALLDNPLKVPEEVSQAYVIKNICTIHSLIDKAADLGFGLTLLDQLTGTNYHYQLEAVEILTGINGVTEVVMGSEKYALRRGDVLAIPPGAVYQMHGKDQARCLSLLFPAWTEELDFILPKEECPPNLAENEKQIQPADALHMKSWLNPAQIGGIKTDIVSRFLVKQDHNLGFDLALLKGEEIQAKENDGQAKILYSLGSANVKINGKVISAKAGDILVIPVDASYEIDAAATVSFVYLSFMPT